MVNYQGASPGSSVVKNLASEQRKSYALKKEKLHSLSLLLKIVGLEPQCSQVSFHEHFGNLKKTPVIYIGQYC